MRFAMPISPLQLFFYGLAVAGSVAAIGLVVLGLVLLYFAAIAPTDDAAGETESDPKEAAAS
jgi:membrane-bound ClpP family serine protease